MTKKEHRRKFSFRSIRKDVLLPIVFAVVALCAVAFMQMNSSAGFKSSELAFTDPSDGMQIVPASCPSDPDDADSPNGCDPGSCSISLSPTSVQTGGSSTLSWSSSGADSVYISNVGSVGTSGSTTVAPGSTTQYYCEGYNNYGGYGAPAYATLTVNAPVCTVTFSQNPIAYGGTTNLSWTTSYASGAYIRNIGYVGTSGSTGIGPGVTTNYPSMDYSCAAYTASAGFGSWYPATLTVTPPPQPSLTIRADASSIPIGNSTGIHSTFAAGSGDTLDGIALDEVPPGSSEETIYSSGPASRYDYTFTPNSTGTYVFKPYAITQYYSPNWSSYGQSVSVTVTASPQCTVSLSPTSITQGQSSTLTYSSSNATSFSIDNVGSLTPNTSVSRTVSPSSSTDYTGTVISGGVTNTCTAPGTSPSGTLTVSCTPAFFCSNASTIQYLHSSCQVSLIGTCGAPGFCSSGSSICLYPTVSFNPSGNLTGDLQLVPNIVHPGGTIQVYWNVSNAQSCTVKGTNGDSWSGLAAPTGGETSRAISGQVIYTLSCPAYGSNPSVAQSQTVNVTPLYQEK
jgi:hypothetical protein